VRSGSPQAAPRDLGGLFSVLFSFDVEDLPTAVQTNGQNMRGWFSSVNDVTTCAIEAPPLDPLRRLTPTGFYIDPTHVGGAGLWRSGQHQARAVSSSAHRRCKPPLAFTATPSKLMSIGGRRRPSGKKAEWVIALAMR
jgi:hypothetical protein